MKEIHFITGASGVGKTTLVETLKKKYSHRPWAFVHFDSIGIPQRSEMEKEFGSSTLWQKAKTFEWIQRLVNEYPTEYIFFEGQVNPQFIIEGFKKYHFSNYRIVLVDCHEDEMQSRLTHHREQPELFTEEMKNWRRYLRNMAEESSIPILDTTGLSPDEMASEFEKLAGFTNAREMI